MPRLSLGTLGLRCEGAFFESKQLVNAICETQRCEISASVCGSVGGPGGLVGQGPGEVVPRVTFASNLLGDVLCSFVRPLKDTVYTVCYLGRAVSGGLQPTHLAAAAP